VYRDIEKDLLNWKQQKEHMPILLRGARQVGKSYVVEKFGRDQFDNILIVNFELQPELCRCFETLQPNEILLKLSLVKHHKIEPGKTLLFLDEIQDCPNAIRALRYFKEQMPELHVIGAGSLLEFTLNDANFRMPVGRVQSLYLKPLSFKEYLGALGYSDLRKVIEQTDLKAPIADVIHQELLKQIRTYMALGGMPSVLKTYLDSEVIAFGNMSRSYDFNACHLQQTTLLSNYRLDFGKYAKHTQIQHIKRVFEKAPGLVGDHFKYSKVDADARSQQIKSALELLQHAGLIYPIYSTSASGIPLISLINEKKFKILFLDVGLMVHASHVEAELLLDNIILINRGAIAEQLVGQELLASVSSFEEAQLYFWCREQKSSMAEVDFIMTVGSKIVPIEVKAGSTGHLKSLRILMQEKNLDLGIRVSQLPLSLDSQILSVPIYMVGEISRLVKSMSAFPPQGGGEPLYA
jgi:predicted AAA+ superfamily ATPase